jgi:hypothetical protein
LWRSPTCCCQVTNRERPVRAATRADMRRGARRRWVARAENSLFRRSARFPRRGGGRDGGPLLGRRWPPRPPRRRRSRKASSSSCPPDSNRCDPAALGLERWVLADVGLSRRPDSLMPACAPVESVVNQLSVLERLRLLPPQARTLALRPARGDWRLTVLTTDFERRQWRFPAAPRRPYDKSFLFQRIAWRRLGDSNTRPTHYELVSHLLFGTPAHPHTLARTRLSALNMRVFSRSIYSVALSATPAYSHALLLAPCSHGLLRPRSLGYVRASKSAPGRG